MVTKAATTVKDPSGANILITDALTGLPVNSATIGDSLVLTATVNPNPPSTGTAPDGTLPTGINLMKFQYGTTTKLVNVDVNGVATLTIPGSGAGSLTAGMVTFT